jgi:hypothetical protein
MVSGALLLGLAAFVVEDLIRDWEARRWRRVAAISYMSLGHLAAKMFRGIEGLLTGDATFIPPSAARAADELKDILTLVAPTGPPWTTGTLEALHRNLRWLKIERAVLEALKFEHREALARWIPSTLADVRLAKVIEHMASLDMTRDHLETAAIRLIKAQDPTYEDYPEPASDIDDEVGLAVRLWSGLQVELVATQEALMRAAGHDGWEHAHARRVLDPALVDRVDDRIEEIGRAFR